MGLLDGLIASLPDAKGSAPSAKSSSGGGGEIESLLRNKAAEYDIDPDLFVSLAKRESGLRPDAKNPGSSAGGLFQFIDGTWNRYGNKKDKFDPEANADAAARMLRDHLGMFDGDYSKALAAHHVGASKAASALTDRRIGDKDVSTQQWLSDIFTGAGRDNPMAKPRGAFADAEAGVGGYDQIRRGQIAQAESDASPVSTSLKRGLKGLTHSAGLAIDNMLGDSEGAAQRIIDKQAFDQATPAPSSVQKFGRDWDALAEDDYTGMFGTILKNPAGSFNMMLEQTPNSLPGMAFQTVAGVAGRGLMALGPVGAAAGLGLQGLSAFAGNFLPEGGAFIEEQLHKSGVDTNDVRAVAKWIEEHRGENFKGGATKAGVISAVDGVTGWMGMKMLAGPSVRFAKAEKDFFAKNGVNVADSAALQAARAGDAYKAAMQPFAADLVKASEGFGMFKRGVGATALDAMGEGVGEYAGSYAATGDASIKDAVLEGVMGVGQGAAMAGAQYGIGKMSGPDLVMEELRKLATANIAPAEAKPNSPLSNAAQAAQAADPITEALKPISERFADRALYEQIRNHPNLGPDAMTQILSAYRVATNSNMDPMARQAAVDRLGEFFRLFDNQPNFTAGRADAPGVPAVVGNKPSAVGPVDPRVGAIDGEASRVAPNQQQGVVTQSAPALATDERARKAAAAEYEAAYQDLVKAEQLGVSDQELMQRQIAMRNAENRLQEINEAIEANRAKETAEKRGALLDRVLASNPGNPNRAFDRALRLEGFRDSTFTEEEKSKISRFNELRSIQEDGVFSAPNEAGAFGIREKRASAPAGRYQHLADMLSSGWQLANRHQLTGPNGEVYNLKGAGEAQFVRNKLNQKAGNGNQSPRDGSQGGTDQGDNGVGSAGANGPVPQGGGNGSGQANAIPDTDAPAGAVSEAEATGAGNQPNNSLARSRLTALEDQRIAKYADELRSMAPDSGWAEEGGRLLIAPDGTKSRTKWIPRAEWFIAGMLNSPQESVAAVEKAISGQPMRKAEKLHVQGMMDFLDMQYGIDGESHAEQLATLSDIAYEGESADAQNIIDTLGDVDLESNGAWADEVESMRALGFTEEEINEITRRKQGAFGAIGEEAAGVPAGEAQTAIPEGDGNGNGQAEGQEGFSLDQQTNEEAAAQFAQQQAGESSDITKEQADKERDAVPFSLAQQSQPKPQGTQVGLFTADGRPSVAAKQPESVKRKIFRDNKETGIREVHEVDAQDVAISGLPDHQFFVFKDEEKGAYSLTEASTGLRVGIGETAEAAIANFKAALEKVGVETFAQRVADSQKITGADETKPAGTQPVAQRSFVRTYKTKSGKIGARIEKVVGPTGKVFYNYTGEWGAGSGHALAQMDKIESMWRKEKRGYTVVEADAAPETTTAEDKLHTKDSEKKSPATLDEFIGAVDAGYRAHYDYSGADGSTVWIEKTEVSGQPAWVMKWIDDDHPGTTQTKGGAGQNVWDKLKALRAVEDKVKYRFTEWKPVAESAPSPVNTSMRDTGAKAFADGLPRVAPEGLKGADKVRWLTGYDDAAKSYGKSQPAASDVFEKMAARMEVEQIEGSDEYVVFERGERGNQNFARFTLGKGGNPVRIKHFFESASTRTPVDMAIKKWAESQQKTDSAKKGQEQAAPVSQPENDKPAYADDAELQDALSHLGDVLGDVFGAKLNITGKQYGASDLLPAMSKVIELLIKKGFKSFRESVGAATNAMRGNANTKGFVDQITPRQWKAAYNSVAEFHEGTESEEDVAKYSAEQIAKIIALPEKIKEAEQATNHDATPGQKEAGNYAKGKFAWHGLNIAVETAKGEDRTDKETNGEKWRVTMPATYGYILGTVGADKDHVDVFMGDKPESQRVYVVNQTKPGSTEFDEHKIMLGYESEGAAIGDYLLSFSDTFGASVLGSVSGPYAIDDFKHMLESNRFSRAKPISDRLAYVNPRVEEKPVEQQPPGVKTNGTKEKAAAERLAQLLDKMDQVRIDRNTPEGSAKGIVRSVIEELRKERTAVSVADLLATASQRLLRQHAPFSEVIDQVVESLRSDASPDNKGDIKQAGVSLDKFGLTVRRSQTKNGTPTWEVSGNTRDHVAVLRNAGGKWYGPKKVWSFFSEESPEGRILAALGASPAASGVALSDIEVERKSEGTGRIKTYKQRADEALSEIDERMSLGKQLLECLNS